MNQDNKIFNIKTIITISIMACLCSMTYVFTFVAVILIIIQRKRLLEAEKFFYDRINRLESTIKELDTTEKAKNRLRLMKILSGRVYIYILDFLHYNCQLFLIYNNCQFSTIQKRYIWKKKTTDI